MTWLITIHAVLSQWPEALKAVQCFHSEPCSCYFVSRIGSEISNSQIEPSIITGFSFIIHNDLTNLRQNPWNLAASLSKFSRHIFTKIWHKWAYVFILTHNHHWTMEGRGRNAILRLPIPAFFISYPFSIIRLYKRLQPAIYWHTCSLLFTGMHDSHVWPMMS